jgi:hypothetical protein
MILNDLNPDTNDGESQNWRFKKWDDQCYSKTTKKMLFVWPSAVLILKPAIQQEPCGPHLLHELGVPEPAVNGKSTRTPRFFSVNL